MAVVRRYSPSIRINAPGHNTTVSGSFTVSGTASCELLEDQPAEPGIFIRSANQEITGVRVTLGAATFDATQAGPPDTPWTSWTFSATGSNGPLTIKAEVTASGHDGTTGLDHDSRSVTVDASPPTTRKVFDV